MITFPLRKIFIPGKIIHFQKGNAIHKLAMIEVEEHIRHVRAMLDWLYGDNSTEIQRYAADFHDIGKKIELRDDFLAFLKGKGKKKAAQKQIDKETLKKDFYGEPVEITIDPEESAKAYTNFLLKAKAYSHIQVEKTFGSMQYRLDPPFGAHAAVVKTEDLPEKVAKRDHIASIIQLHHTFRPDRVIEAAAEHGEEVLHGLYRLIVCDHFASEWASYVVNTLEQNEQPEYRGKMRFAEVTVEKEGEPEMVERKGASVIGRISLKCNDKRLTLEVSYYLADFDFSESMKGTKS